MKIIELRIQPKFLQSQLCQCHNHQQQERRCHCYFQIFAHFTLNIHPPHLPAHIQTIHHTFPLQKLSQINSRFHCDRILTAHGWQIPCTRRNPSPQSLWPTNNCIEPNQRATTPPQTASPQFRDNSPKYSIFSARRERTGDLCAAGLARKT